MNVEVEYSKALNEFILNMEKLPPVIDHSEIDGFSEKICRILRISRFEVYICEPPKNSENDKYDINSGVIFADGTFDSNKAFSMKKVIGDGCRAEYTAYPYADAPDWTDNEMRLIEVFIKTVFVFNGISGLMNTAESLAFKDSDLGIHNINYFVRHYAGLLSSDQLEGFTCCRFNLKRFSVVNRRFGRTGGTEIMKKYIYSLMELIGEEGTVCRTGGDHFIAIFPEEKNDAVQSYLMATTITTGVKGLDKITISARAGYCPISYDCHNIMDLMDRVTAAESIAQNNPNLPYVYYDDKTRHKTETSKWIEGLFDDALNDEEFLVYYQPKVNLNDNSLVGAEALCRWKHNGEIIQPTRFIPIFEQTNNICVLDFYMLEHICQDIRHWLDNNIPVVKISAHMSRVNLGSDDLASRIIEIINRYNIPKEYIEIELKETTTDVDFYELKRVVTALDVVGISTSIDSFGVRYSSLNLIRDLPWNVLKIDRSLLPDGKSAETDEQNKIILKYIIGLSQALGLECVAEGVETANQVEVLKDSGCFKAQGFFFDRPLPVERFEEKLTNNHCYNSSGSNNMQTKQHSKNQYIDELLD